MTGFLLGAVSAGGALYYYVIDEYKVSNELLTEDIYVSAVFQSGVLPFDHGLTLSSLSRLRRNE